MALSARILACVIAVGASAPAAAGPAPAPEQIEAEFEARAAGAERTLAEMKSIRTSFKDAADKDAAVGRWAALTAEFSAFWRWEEVARSVHAQHTTDLRFIEMARGFNDVRRGGKLPTKEKEGLKRLADADEEMRARFEGLLAAFKDEEALFVPMREVHLRRKALRRRLGGALAAVLLLAGGAAGLFAYGGRRARAPLPPQTPAPAAGMVAGNYEVVRLLGRGSVGEVYEAVDKTLQRRTALKRLRPELLGDPEGLAGMLKEARLMAGLKHPNLVAVYGVERDAGQVYLALEFVEGETLEGRLRKAGRLPWPEALRVLEGAAAAVDYAHARKVIHRDIKPANIMLASDGGVKVADFGIAYQAARSVSRLTRAPSWGTPPYMAPEQELGGLSAGVDVYALAVCLFEAATGQLPFKGPNFLAQKRESLWEKPSRLAPDLPRGIDGLFEIALAPEAGRRFPSAAALVSAGRALSDS